MNSFWEPDRIGPNQAALLQNADIGSSGLSITRRGSEQIANQVQSGTVIRGLSFMNTPTIERLLVASNAKLFYWDGVPTNNWVEITGMTFSTGEQVAMVQGVDKMLMAANTKPYSYDGTTVTQLAAGPVCRYLAWHTMRLFAAGISGANDTLQASQFLDPSVWNAVNFSTRVGGGEGSPIRAIVPAETNNLVVLKRNSIWVVHTDPTKASADEWEQTLLHKEIGCVASRSAVQVGQDVWFLSDTGVRSIKRTVATLQQEVSLAISEPIHDLIQRINWNTASLSCACFHGNRYMIAVPLDGASQPNCVLVYNTLRQSWSGFWLGMNPTVFAESLFGDVTRLCFGRADGYVWGWLGYVAEANETDATFTDVGAPIPTEIITRAMIWNDPVAYKAGYNMFLEFYKSRALTDLYAIKDFSTPILMESQINTGGDPLRVIFNLPNRLSNRGINRRIIDLARFDAVSKLQFRLYSGQGKLAFRNLHASAFVEALLDEEPVRST